MNQAVIKAVGIAGSQRKLAALCGVTQPTVWRWVHGSGIEIKHAFAIETVTKGAVTLRELAQI